MSKRVFLAAMVFLMLLCATASASGPTRPMLAALDSAAADYAVWHGWSYTDRLADSYRGNWKVSYATVVLEGDGEYTDENGKKSIVSVEWEVEARIVRCGPGWYVVSFPDRMRTCRTKAVKLPQW